MLMCCIACFNAQAVVGREGAKRAAREFLEEVEGEIIYRGYKIKSTWNCCKD